MYKSKPYQPPYSSKEIFTVYIFRANFFFYVKRLKTYSGLNVTAFDF